MTNEIIKRGANRVPVQAGITNDANEDIRMIRVDPTTGGSIIDGTINIKNSSDVTINPSTSDNQTSGNQKTQVRAEDSPSVDAFGRWRISNPHTIFDTKLTHTNEPEFWDDQETSGGGTTSTHSADRASVILAVSANTAGKRVRQTFARPNYQPGKSQQVTLTGILGIGESGLTTEIGDHDDENGLFFRNKDSVIYVVKKSFVSGSAVDTAVAQTDWNLDKLDGIGVSGITLDPSKIQIFLIDYQWLGAGRVRFGFDFGGNITYVHEMKFSNIETSVYMSNPSNPIRYSIENDGTAGALDMEQICSSIISEGGAEGTGVDYWFSTEGTHVDANTANTVYALVGVKLQTGHKGEPIKFRNVSVLTQTNDDFEWLLIRNPTVAGTFTYTDTASGPFQSAKGVTANTVTGGDVIAGGFGHAGTVQSSDIGYEGGFGEAIDGTRDEFILCVRPLSANADIEGGITLQVNH